MSGILNEKFPGWKNNDPSRLLLQASGTLQHQIMLIKDLTSFDFS